MKIKFKGVKKGTQNEWVFGWYVFSRSRHYILEPYNESGGYDERWETSEWIEIMPESLGLFTGKKDINDNEIYFGDIVEYGTTEGTRFVKEVGWDKKNYQLK